ncbi:MAG: hypothetical protein IJ060_07200 [Oscillospiraceae bacterium]|nr:hypothetical protein [Oscillospiraceae bacterium]
MKIVKRISAGALAAALALSASACGKSDSDRESPAKSSAAEGSIPESSVQESMPESETEPAQEPDESGLPESARDPGNLFQALYIGCPKEETDARLQSYGFEFNATLNAEVEGRCDTDQYWFNGNPGQLCLTGKIYDDSFMKPNVRVSYNEDGLLCYYELSLLTKIPYDADGNVQHDDALETVNYLWGAILDDIYGQGRVEEQPSNLFTYYQTCWEDDAGTVQIDLSCGFASSQSNHATIKCGSQMKDQPLMEIARIR